MKRLCAVVLFAMVMLLAGPPAGERATAPGRLAGLPSIADLVGVTPASAQTARQGERKSLFRAIFGRRKAKRKEVRPKVTKRRTTTRSTSTKKRRTKSVKRVTKRAAVAAPAAQASAPVEKSEDAITVLVAGDFYSDDIYEGLQQAFADEPNVVLVNRSNGLSGFVRTDIVDWPATIGPMVEEVKPDYLVFLAGSNDRQLLVEDGKRYDKLTPGWQEAYKGRLAAMGEALKATDVPFTWVGLPSVRFDTMSRDFISMNEWYAAAAALAPRGKFVDVWDGFADANGNYSRSGPDVNGQITLLRRKDGINMTDAGEERLAFYVQDDIRKVIDGKVPATTPAGEFDGLVANGPARETYDPVASGRTIVVNLDDPVADGGEVLAGETIQFAPQAVGEAASPVPAPAPAPVVQRQGRADDFSWPPAGNSNDVIPPRAVAARADEAEGSPVARQ